MSQLFLNMSVKEKDKILKNLEAITLTFPKNANVFSTINCETMLGIIEYGHIQIIKTDYNGNRIIIDELSDNDVFGYLLTPSLNNECDIIVKQDSKITFIEYAFIFKKSDNNSSYYPFIRNLLMLMTDTIHQKNQRIEILTKKSIRNKILEYFRFLEKRNGTKSFLLPISFTELADYLAIDRSAMSRELKNLKEEGFIKIKNKKVTLLY